MNPTQRHRPEHRLAAQAAQGEAAVETRATHASIGALLASHVLQDGELILLVLKPSIWFIALSALRFAAGVLILLIAAVLLDQQLPGPNKHYIEAAAFVLAGRFMWAALQWMGRLYVLTDMRIVRVAGVFNVNLFDCPLRRVARTRVIRSTRERLFALGTIEITPGDETTPPAHWQMISRPHQVHEQILAAITRARQGRATPGVG